MDFTTEVRDEILEMVQDMRIKPSLSSPPQKKVWEGFSKNICGGSGRGGGFGGGVLCFTWGLISDYARREEKFHKCIF